VLPLLVAKRLDSRYEAGMRSGAWQKMRVNQEQEFVIGGYTPTAKNFDALVFGYYEGDKLIYGCRRPCRSSSGGLAIDECPFVNLPEAGSGRWRQGLTAEKMKECRWLLCRMRHSSHNVECRTMPQRLLPVLPFLRSTSFCSA